MTNPFPLTGEGWGVILSLEILICNRAWFFTSRDRRPVCGEILRGIIACKDEEMKQGRNEYRAGALKIMDRKGAAKRQGHFRPCLSDKFPGIH